VSAIEAENIHFRALSDSRISSCEKQFLKNINSATDSLVKTIESTRRDVSNLQTKMSQDAQLAQQRGATLDSLEGSYANIAATVASMHASITSISGVQADLAVHLPAASKSIEEIKSECQRALTVAQAVEEKIELRLQNQFSEILDLVDAIDAQLTILTSGSQQRLEKRLAVIRDEISGHTSHSNIVFDRFQKDMLEMQAKLSKLSVEIVGSAQRADLSHQSLKETLLPSVSSLQASVNTLAFRLSRSVTSFEEEVNTIKNCIDSRVTNLAHEVAVFSCLEDVISRIEYDDVSSQVSLLQVQTTSSARTAIAAVAERLQQLEISVQTMDSDQIVAADLFSKRLVCAEDSVAATSDHLELFNTQNTLIMTNMKAIEAQIESHNTEIGVVVETIFVGVDAHDHGLAQQHSGFDPGQKRSGIGRAWC
jgi:chromosome segregation ATPase